MQDTSIEYSTKTKREFSMEPIQMFFVFHRIEIPLAAGVWYPIFGWELNPMFGAAAMGP